MNVLDLPPGTMVAVVEAPDGVPATTLGALASDDLQTITFSPGPERRRASGVGVQVLEALGKSRNVTGKSRHATTEAEMATLWLNAHGTRVLIATACQHTPVPDLIALTEMCAATPTAVVFAVDHGYARDLLTALAPVAPQKVPWPTLPAGIERDAKDEAATAGSRPVPIPDIEYWTFYATAKRLLTAAQFDKVHSLYLDAHTRVTGWLYDMGAAGRDITMDGAVAVFSTLAEDYDDLGDVTVVTRAAQAAFHNAGWVALIDDRELRAASVRHFGTPNHPEFLRRLRAYREPARAANIALYLNGATPVSIEGVTVDDLAQWHADPSRSVAAVTVPADASPYLVRRSPRASPRRRKPVRPGLSRLGTPRAPHIRKAAADLGLNLGGSKLSSTSTIHQKRHPKSLVKLERIG